MVDVLKRCLDSMLLVCEDPGRFLYSLLEDTLGGDIVDRLPVETHPTTVTMTSTPSPTCAAIIFGRLAIVIADQSDIDAIVARAFSTTHPPPALPDSIEHLMCWVVTRDLVAPFKILVKAGGDVNTTILHGHVIRCDTLLELAFEHNAWHIFPLLLKEGADPNVEIQCAPSYPGVRIGGIVAPPRYLSSSLFKALARKICSGGRIDWRESLVALLTSPKIDRSGDYEGEDKTWLMFSNRFGNMFPKLLRRVAFNGITPPRTHIKEIARRMHPRLSEEESLLKLDTTLLETTIDGAKRRLQFLAHILFGCRTGWTSGCDTNGTAVIILHHVSQNLWQSTDSFDALVDMVGKARKRWAQPVAAPLAPPDVIGEKRTQ